MIDPTIFTVGGTVQAGDGIYLPRPADDELLHGCLAGDFCYVLTARQMGKSSLMVRTSDALRDRQVRTVILDLTRLGTTLQPEQWYLGLVDELVEQLDLDMDYKAWWQAHTHLGVTQRLNRFLRETVLEAITQPLVIFIDEIDTTLSLTFADDFFAAIRACYNTRSTDPAYKRLSFVLLGVATPGDLIRDPQRTPFNIGTRIDLTDFTLKEALPLAQGFTTTDSQPQIEILRWVMDWTGGHPYLTQRLCHALVDAKRETWDEVAVTEVVEQTFFGERSKQDGNLQFVRDMLTRRAPDEQKVLDVYYGIRQGKKIRNDEQSLIVSHLKISGIIKVKTGMLVVRNPIYAYIFDLDWILHAMPLDVTKRIRDTLIAPLIIITIYIVFLAISGQLNSLIFRPLDMKDYWVTIPSGLFQMGSDSANYDAKPVHSVYIENFDIGRYEITNRQYEQCVRVGICSEPRNQRYASPEYASHPVTHVNWNDAVRFCAWLGGRLPTEAEWEKAARNGLANKKYPWGDELPICNPGMINAANFSTANRPGCTGDTLPVGSYFPSSYGIYDLAGNVWEWTHDLYSSDYYGLVSQHAKNPRGPEYGDGRVIRGGAFGTDETHLDVAMRLYYHQLTYLDSLGFRCARSK